MSRRPSMQFYPADFLGGTALFSRAATGAYMTMLCHSWETGPIPDTRSALFKAMGLGPDDPPFELLWTEIKPKWSLIDGGWTNARLERTRADRDKFIDGQRAKGRLGGRPRKPEESRGLDGEKAGASKNAKPDESQTQSPVKAENNLSDLRSSSPISDLHSPDPDRQAARTGRAPAKGPRAPQVHGHESAVLRRACQRGMCLPDFLVREFQGQSGLADDDAKTYVETFITMALDSIDGQPIGDDPIKLWRAWWARPDLRAATAPKPDYRCSHKPRCESRYQHGLRTATPA